MKNFSQGWNGFLIVFSLAFLGCCMSSLPHAHALSLMGEKPLALIYKGLGSCSEDQADAGTPAYGCSEASADAAVAAGFQYQFVGPTDLSNEATDAEVNALFGKAKVWIQPGGNADAAYSVMTSKLIGELIKFVSNGGGYVGFCAGAFLAADWFNIFPGTADLYGYKSIRSDVDYSILGVDWNGASHMIYFEGGPYLHDLDPTAQVMATFTGTTNIAAARAPYGKGRVYISGPHPEAPELWSSEDGVADPDGSDVNLAVQMIGWAAGLSND